ncbi:MAG: IS91 family transposase [Methanothrix sp.]|jgi:hypothetical protein|nr:IS91 family transposase [Methanothrix sp.]
MLRPSLEVADILREYGAAFSESCGGLANREMRRVMEALKSCRTSALGGHKDKCDNDDCGHELISYNSCRNRHCPKCQALAKEKWLQARLAELLPVPYFHVVFTLPHELSALALQNRREVYGLLFRAASETLLKIAGDPNHLGAKIGFFGILHTWGQALVHHPHVHFVVPGGGISPDGERWISSRQEYLLPVPVLSKLFQGIFLYYLKKAFDGRRLEFHGQIEYLAEQKGFRQLLKALYRKKKWVVYTKEPFGGPQQVLEYVGRYTHRVALSNHRLVKMEVGTVTFRYKDYHDGSKVKEMTLDAGEFIRRFLLHVLPDKFVKLRYFGLMSNRKRKGMLERCRELLGASDYIPPELKDWRTQNEESNAVSVDSCPKCGKGKMRCVEKLEPLWILKSSCLSRLMIPLTSPKMDSS